MGPPKAAAARQQLPTVKAASRARGHVKVPPLDPRWWGVWLTTHPPLLTPTRRRLQRGF
jgi:hypothetical protein